MVSEFGGGFFLCLVDGVGSAANHEARINVTAWSGRCAR